MKIALLLSGDIRNLKENYTNLKNNLLDLYDIDVFLSVWSDDGLTEINELVKPLVFDAEKYTSDYENVWNSNISNLLHKGEKNTNLINCLSMWYKTNRVNQLKNNYEKLMGFRYDVVLKSRPDLKIETPVDMFIPKKNTIYIPKGWDWSGGINDLMAYSDSKTMDVYSDLYNSYYHILNQSERKLNAELILKNYLKFFTNLSVERPQIDVTLRNINIKSTYYFQKGK